MVKSFKLSLLSVALLEISCILSATTLSFSHLKVRAKWRLYCFLPSLPSFPPCLWQQWDRQCLSSCSFSLFSVSMFTAALFPFHNARTFCLFRHVLVVWATSPQAYQHWTFLPPLPSVLYLSCILFKDTCVSCFLELSMVSTQEWCFITLLGDTVGWLANSQSQPSMLLNCGQDWTGMSGEGIHRMVANGVLASVKALSIIH